MICYYNIVGEHFMKNIDEIISSLSLEEKCRLLSGHDTMRTFPIEEKGIRALTMSDGPHGLRKQLPDGDSLSGISKTLPSTCFPTGITLASSFNEELLYKVGKAIGEECVDNNVNVILGPAFNIQRNPLCGRNFEYYSEDPLLAGKLASCFINGVQSNGVGACIKHYACNSNEKYRFMGDSIVDKRALHEIYLKGFEIAVKESKPYAAMTAYNQVNGVFCSENDYLLNKCLRDNWGFDGLAMTDWGGLKDKTNAINNGLSLVMPGMDEYHIKKLYDSVKSGKINISKVDRAVKELLLILQRTENPVRNDCDYKKHYELAVKAAIEGSVLLKKGSLPLKSSEHYLVIGDLFRRMRYQGSGSSLLNPYLLKSHEEYFNESHIDYEFVRGYNESELVTDKVLYNEAINKAKDYNGTILFYGGQNDYVESEGFDRENMVLPANQTELLNELIRLNKKIVFVLFGGSPVELPFLNDVDALLNMNLAGEGEGEATTKILFGEASPQGRLPQSWIKHYDDVPFGKEYTSSPKELYKESIFVGYRNYTSRNITLKFPFGYGLSYSDFKYDNYKVTTDKNSIIVSLDITNIGDYDDSEVIQIYVSKPDSSIVRPAKELKGFKKVFLCKNETKTVQISIPFADLAIYHIDRYVVEDGEYIIHIAKNVNEDLCSNKVNVKGEKLVPSRYDKIYKEYLINAELSKEQFEEVMGHKIPDYVFNKRPYTIETPIGEFKTWFGKIFARSVTNVGYKQYKAALKLPDGPEKEREKKAGLFVYKLMPNNSLRSLANSSSGLFPYKLALGILELTNNHFIKGIKIIMKKEKYEYGE